jgi:tol-pal system protein YbgF
MNKTMTNQTAAYSRPIRLALVALLASTVLFASSPAFAVNKDMVQLQTQIQELQDAVARLQQSNDERMGVMKDLVQQSADSVNKMSANLDAAEKQMQVQQTAQGGKLDQLSGQIQSLNDSMDDIRARLAALQKIMQDVQSQQQSIGAGSSGQSASGGAATSPAPMSAAPAPSSVPNGANPAPIVRQGKPSGDVPLAGGSASPAVPPVDDLYKAALGDYMSAKYGLSSSEFGDVIKSYPDNPLAGNSYYYQGEIEYRAGRYATAIKAYDSVINQFPDSNKVPVSRLHKGMALIALRQTDAGVHELRGLIQRFPNSPESMQARSKLSGMGIPVTPRR